MAPLTSLSPLGEREGPKAHGSRFTLSEGVPYFPKFKLTNIDLT